MQRARTAGRLGRRLPTFPADAKGMATRESSGKVLNAIAPNYPWLVGGAADLAPSTKTNLNSMAPASSSRNAAAAATCISASASTPWARSSTGWRSPACGLRLDLSDLLRLHEAADPPRGAHGAAGHLRLHARLHRPWRGRPDTSAGRAAPCAALACRASSRCAPRTPTRSPRPSASIARLKHNPACLCSAASRCRHSIAAAMRRRRASPAAPMCWPIPTKPDVILIGTGSEVRLCVEAFETLKQRASRRGWSACRPGSCSRRRTKPIGIQCCRRTSRPASRSRGLGRSGGTAMSARRRRDRHAYVSARRRRSRTC